VTPCRDGRESLNVFLPGRFACDFGDRVAEVTLSAVVGRARDGAIHGSISHGPKHCSAIAERKPALPAGEVRRCHVRRNHGYIHTLFATRETRTWARSRSVSARFSLARSLKGFYLQKNCMRLISSFASFSRGCVVALIQTCNRR